MSKENDMPSVLLNVGNTNAQAQQGALVLDNFQTSRSPSVTLTFLGCPSRATQISLDMEGNSQIIHTSEDQRKCSESSHARKSARSDYVMSSVKSKKNSDEFELRRANVLSEGKEKRTHESRRKHIMLDVQLRPQESRCCSSAKQDIQLYASTREKNTQHDSHFGNVNIQLRRGNGIANSTAAFPKSDKLNDGEFTGNKTEKEGSRSSPPHIPRTERTHTISPRRSTSSTNEGAQRKKSLERSSDGKTAVLTSQRVRSSFRGHKYKSEGGRFIDDVDGTNTGYLSVDHLDNENPSPTIVQLIGERAHGDNKITKSPPKVDVIVGNVIHEKEIISGEDHQCVLPKDTSDTLQLKPEDPGLTNISQPISTGHRHLSKLRSRNHPTTDKIFIDVMKLLVTQSDPRKPCYFQEVSANEIQLGPSSSLSDKNLYPSSQQLDSLPEVNFTHLQENADASIQKRDKHTFPCLKSDPLRSTKTITISSHSGDSYRSRDGEYETADRNGHNHVDEEQNRCGDFWSISDSEHSSPSGSSRQSFDSSEDVEARAQTRREGDENEGKHLSVREMVRALQERLETTSQAGSSRDSKRIVHRRVQSASPSSSLNLTRKYLSEFNDISKKQQNDLSLHMKSRPKEPSRETRSLLSRLADRQEDLQKHVEKSTETQEKPTLAVTTQTSDLAVGQAVGAHVTEASWEGPLNKNKKKASRIPIKRHIIQLSKLILKSSERIRNQFTAHVEVEGTSQTDTMVITPAKDCISMLQEKIIGETDVTQKNGEDNASHLVNKINIIITPPSPVSLRAHSNGYTEDDEPIGWSDYKDDYLQIPETSTCPWTQHPDMALMDKREQQMNDNFRKHTEKIESDSAAKRQLLVGGVSPLLKSFATDTRALLFGTQKSLSCYLKKARAVLRGPQPTLLNESKSNDQMKDDVCEIPTFFKIPKSLSSSDLQKGKITSECHLQPDRVCDLPASSTELHVTTPKSVSETDLIIGDAHPPIYCLHINNVSRGREDMKPIHRCDPFRGNAALREYVFESKQAGPSAHSISTVGKSQAYMLKQTLSNNEDVMEISVSYDEKSSKKILEKNDHHTSPISEENNKKNQKKLFTGLITERDEILPSSFRFGAPRLGCTEENSPPYLQVNEENSGADGRKGSALGYEGRDSSHVMSNCAVPTEEIEEGKLVLQSCASCSDCKRDSDDNSLQDDVSSLAPIKSLSLVNAADAGHTDSEVTDVIALLSPEVNIKRYPSFPDLTDIHDENDPLMGTMEGGPPVKILLGIERTTDQHHQSEEGECARQSINQSPDQPTDILSDYFPKCQQPFSLASIEEEKVPPEPFSNTETTIVKKPAIEGHPQTEDNTLHGSVNPGTTWIGTKPLQDACNVSKLNRNAYFIASNSEKYQLKEPKESHLLMSNSEKFESAASSRNRVFDEHNLPSPPDHSLSDTSNECDRQDWVRDNDPSDGSVSEMQVDKAQSTSKAATLSRPVGCRDHLGRLRAALNEHYDPLTEETSSVQGLHSKNTKQLFTDSELSSQVFDRSQTIDKENSICLDCTAEMMTINTHVKQNQADRSLLAYGKPGQKHFAERHCEDKKLQSLNQRALAEKWQNKEDINYDEETIFNPIPDIPNVDACRIDEHEPEFHQGCIKRQKYASASQDYPDSRELKGQNDTAAQNTCDLMCPDFNKSRSFQRLDEKGYSIFNVCDQSETKDPGIIESTAAATSYKENKETPVLQNADNISSILATAVEFPCDILRNNEDNQTVDICPKPPRPRKQITYKEDIQSNQRDDLNDSLRSSGDESVSDRSNSCLQDEDSHDDANGGKSSFIITGSELGYRDVPVAKSSGMYTIYSRNTSSDKLDRTLDVNCTARLPRPTMPLTFKEVKQKPLRCNVNNNVSVVCSEVHCGKVSCMKHVQKQRSVCLHLNRSASGSAEHMSDSVLDPKSSVPRNYMITSVSKIIGATDQDDSYDQSVTRNVNETPTTDTDISYSVYSSQSDVIHNQEQSPGTEPANHSPTVRNGLKSASCHFSVLKESSGAPSEMTSTSGDALKTGFSKFGFCKSAFIPYASQELLRSKESFFFHSHCGDTESINAFSTLPINSCQINANVESSSRVFSSVGCDLILSDTQPELKDRMPHSLSQRIQSSGKDNTKAFNFMSRTQKHLDKCDELINRSSRIISMSQETVRHSQKMMEYTAKAMNLRDHTSLIS